MSASAHCQRVVEHHRVQLPCVGAPAAEPPTSDLATNLAPVRVIVLEVLSGGALANRRRYEGAHDGGWWPGGTPSARRTMPVKARGKECAGCECVPDVRLKLSRGAARVGLFVPATHAQPAAMGPGPRAGHGAFSRPIAW